MGNKGVQLCFNCFGRSRREEDQATSVVSKPSLSDPSVLKLSPEDQRLLSTLGNCFEAFLKLVEMPPEEDKDLELIVRKENCEVYGKDTDRGFLLRSEWLIPLEAEHLIRFLGDLDRRPAWDKNLESLKCLRMLTPDTGLFYQTYKKVFMMAQRDLLIVSRMFRVGEAWVDLSTSVELEEVQEVKDVVRMKLYMGGYYAEPLSTPVGDLITKVTCVSECDFGGSVPKALVKKISAITIPSFIQSVLSSHPA